MSPRQSTNQQPELELAVAIHVTLFVVGVSWAFGGNADWVRTPISVWGSLGIVLAIYAATSAWRRNHVVPMELRWAWPVAVLNAIVLASCLTPAFRLLDFGGELMMMPVRVRWWVPSATRATLALHALWLFDGIYFSCLNVALAVRRRKTIRLILAVAIANAVALSVFGTVQKLVNATGLYFGAVQSPQVFFFASFVYDNHWGAFIVLMSAACIGLLLRHARRSQSGGIFHGPALGGLVALALLIVSVPLSGSRAGTAMLGLLVCTALIKGGSTVSRALRTTGAPSKAVYAAVVLAMALLLAGGWMVAGKMIEAKASQTKGQVYSMWSHPGLGTRAILYADTWRMAKERILFGWGMGSYPAVFGLFNSQKPNSDRLPVIYHDAHSDWLQSMAEIGAAGTALIGASVLLPLRAIRRLRIESVPFFLLTGCGLVATYALVEFPFGNVAVVLSWWLLYLCAVQYARLMDLRGSADAPA